MFSYFSLCVLFLVVEAVKVDIFLCGASSGIIPSIILLILCKIIIGEFLFPPWLLLICLVVDAVSFVILIYGAIGLLVRIDVLVLGGECLREGCFFRGPCRRISMHFGWSVQLLPNFTPLSHGFIKLLLCFIHAEMSDILRF